MNKTIHNPLYKQAIELLKKKRTDLGITQEELAKRLNVKQGFVSKIETCERRLDIVELRNICISLGVSFIDFAKEFDGLKIK